MKREDYLYCLADYFVRCGADDLGEEVSRQVERCLLDYLGCAVFAAAYDCSPECTDLIYSMGPGSRKSSVWGRTEKLAPALAACANAARVSSIELDDCSGIGASVHPGVYVMSSSLALWEACEGKEADFIRAAAFGYDVCMRMGLLATERVRELGLHGPGLVGGMAAAASASILLGLDTEQTCSALRMASSLLPLCPFSAFMEGASVKDLYGGWGVMLGLLAAEAAKKGMTGPVHVIEGAKSLACIFAGDRGIDVEPGTHFYINDVSFKQFSACHSVHPAMTAVQRLLEEHPLVPEEIKEVTVATYPYSYALNEGVHEPLNASSARLSLPFTVAVALIEGHLSPLAFLPDGLSNPRYLALSRKVRVEKNEAYGDGPFGIRGTRLTVTMRDGSVYEKEVLAPNWEKAPDNEALLEKFRSLSKPYLDGESLGQLETFAMNTGSRDIRMLTEAMGHIRRAAPAR